MKTVTADQKRRVSLPDAEPVRRALETAPLTPPLSWDELRRQTREP